MAEPVPGPWFTANYGGTCSRCGGMFREGDRIRADGHGMYGGQTRYECCSDEDDDDMRALAADEAARDRDQFVGTTDEQMGF
jgi:hypothetical protein